MSWWEVRCESVGMLCPSVTMSSHVRRNVTSMCHTVKLSLSFVKQLTPSNTQQHSFSVSISEVNLAERIIKMLIIMKHQTF